MSSVYHTSRAPGKTAAKSVKREIVEWVLTIAFAVALALGVSTWVGKVMPIEGPSMQPGLHTGERVVIGRVEYYFSKPKRGDIVLTHFPEEKGDFIKRVIALGGETVAIHGGSVYIDGRKLDEPYLLEPIQYDFDEITVPEDSIFVLGDNRNDSHDGHEVGPVKLSMVEGRAYALVWPLSKWKKLTGFTGSLEQ